MAVERRRRSTFSVERRGAVGTCYVTAANSFSSEKKDLYKGEWDMVYQDRS
jgi:hypothetical protein